MGEIKLTQSDVGRMSYRRLVNLFGIWSGNVAIDRVNGLPGELELSQSNKNLLELEVLKRHPKNRKKEHKRNDASMLADMFEKAIIRRINIGKHL